MNTKLTDQEIAVLMSLAERPTTAVDVRHPNTQKLLNRGLIRLDDDKWKCYAELRNEKQGS